jgi:type IV pilus assembly protein PilA
MFNRLKDERGFTLIELLVVVLIIGILAAVALPTFLGQRDKGFDADAKSNARNVQTLVESCGVDKAGDYTTCTTANLRLENGGLPWGTAKGQVNVVPNGTTGYAVTAYSKAGGSTARNFVITKNGTGVTKTATGGGSW